MAFARDGRWLAIDDGGRIRLVDPESGREVAALDAGTGSSASFFCMALSPDSAMLAAGRDHIVHLWDLRRIREQLAPLRLDWNAPPFPSPAAHRAVASVVVVGPTNDGANPDPKQPSTASEDRPDDTASAH